MKTSKGSGKLLVFTLSAAAVAIPAHASNLFITPIFDTSITSQADAAGIEGAINSAISMFESTYSNPVNVTIEFYANSTGLGESQEGFVDVDTYTTYYNALVAEDANPLAIAGLISSGGNGTDNPVNGTTSILVKSALNRALGLGGGPLCNVVASGNSSDPLTCSGTPGGAGAVDGLIGLNTGITFPPNGQSGSTYSLLATAEHEIDEVLGLGSSVPNCTSGTCSATTPSPEDLFRYTAANTFATLSENCSSLTQAYLSYSGTNPIVNMNTACNGGDWGDWTGSGTVQNWQANPGSTAPYSSNELDAMSAIGYGLQSSTPEPATFGLIGASLIGFGLLRKGLRRKS